MSQLLTNDLLNDLLAQLGFESTHAPSEAHRTWRHPESGCMLTLPANKAQQPPRSADLVGVRAQLDLHGHLDQSAFDSFALIGNLAAVSETRP